MTKVERVVAPTSGSCIWSFEEKVIDRSAVCGDASGVVWCGPHQQPISGADNLNVTAREGHNQPTQLTKIMSKCHAGA